MGRAVKAFLKALILAFGLLSATVSAASATQPDGTRQITVGLVPLRAVSMRVRKLEGGMMKYPFYWNYCAIFLD